MADVIDTGGSLASWVQAGGVVAFATAVMLELRALRPVMAEVRTLLAQLLERERMRGERIAARETHQPQYRQVPQAAPAPAEYDETPPLGTVDIGPESSRRPRTNPHGYPAGDYSVHRPGTKGGGR